MGLSSDFTNWLKLLGALWGAVAYLGAGFCAFDIFARIKGRGPRPFCTMAAVTRLILRVPLADRSVTWVDMMRIGSMFVLGGSICLSALNAVSIMQIDWSVSTNAKSLAWTLSHIVMGSGLMIVLTGAVHLLDGDAE
jgi:hypothetical protein